MGSKYSAGFIIGANAETIERLSHSLDTSAHREEWERVQDTANRIMKLAKECLDLSEEAYLKEKDLMDVRKFWTACRVHDWFYEYADDPAHIVTGETMSIISAVLRKVTLD